MYLMDIIIYTYLIVYSDFIKTYAMHHKCIIGYFELTMIPIIAIHHWARSTTIYNVMLVLFYIPLESSVRASTMIVQMNFICWFLFVLPCGEYIYPMQSC